MAGAPSLFTHRWTQLARRNPAEGRHARGSAGAEGGGFSDEVVTSVRDRVVAWAYLLAWKIVCRVPRRFAEWAFRQFADWLWWRQGPAVRQLEANLARVARARDRAGPEQFVMDLRKLSRAGMRSYLRYWLEVFRLPELPREEIVGKMRCTGEVQTALRQLAAGRGVIFALPHMGNWKQAGAWIVQRGAGKFTTVAERLRPEWLYQKFVAFRESLGMEVLPHAGGPSRFGVLAQRLRAGGLVCLLCERDLTGSGIEVEFFGEPARVMGGAAALAVHTGAALMPVTLWFDGPYCGAHVHREIAVPADGDRGGKVAVMTQQLARVFEAGITEHPEDWHMLQKVFVADLDPARLERLRTDLTARPAIRGMPQASAGAA
jgi:phosphatidylinositol dimannoside acyltransferase